MHHSPKKILCLYFNNYNMDFTYLYKKKFYDLDSFSQEKEYDYFVSTFNDSERVCLTFNKIHAKNKIWFLLPDYKNDLFFNRNDSYIDIQYEDYSMISDFLDKVPTDDKCNLCIDITGFLTHQMFFMLMYLHKVKKIKKIDVIYSEPLKYRKAEHTTFSDHFYDVTQIPGYGGIPSPNTSNDLLIIAAGYDDSRITDVANKKAKATKIQLFGLPSLQADMFQENILRAHRAEPAVGSESFKNLDSNLFSPANDPFVTAQVLKKHLEKSQKKRKYTNIYLSPISSKPHALGIALFYLWEAETHEAMSVIYPMCKKYYGNNSEGFSKLWRYTLELPFVP